MELELRTLQATECADDLTRQAVMRLLSTPSTFDKNVEQWLKNNKLWVRGETPEVIAAVRAILERRVSTAVSRQPMVG